MEVVKEKSDISKLVDNQIYGDIELKNAQIEWKGTGNVLYCVGKIQLENCKIRFTGNHSLIYFDENLYPFSIDIRVGNDSVFYLGKDCYLNKTSHIYATERKNILIGNQCLLSFDCYFRIADPHLIYDTKTKQRLDQEQLLVEILLSVEKTLIKYCICWKSGKENQKWSLL